jgi:signal transduction histidine kinase
MAENMDLPKRQDWIRRLPPRMLHGAPKRIGLSLVYALLFVGLHHVAARWAAWGLYSLWFPGAGLRFAFLWRRGPGIVPVAALAELIVEIATGEIRLTGSPALQLLGVVGPCLVYGLVIHLVQRHAGRRSPMLRLAPLPFALAAMIGPVVACIAALPWAIPQAGGLRAIDLRALVSALCVFTLGDMLGVLIVAPPLLWLASRFAGERSWRIVPPRAVVVVEAVSLLGFAWGVVWLLDWAGLGLWLAPLLLAVCWIGLRTGRAGAWVTILLAAAIVLPITSSMANAQERLGLHMLLACIAAVGYLSGSFAEAEERSRIEIARRDRILFQAERLKTLRAMSVAVIHEISQPLSTIAIEAHHLSVASTARLPDFDEISDTAGLIARKAGDLAQMVRRLRRFGDRAADEPSAIPLALLLGDVAAIAEPEAKAARIALHFVPGPEATVYGQDVELRQALLNLVRNALTATAADRTVELSYLLLDGRVHMLVTNAIDPAAPPRAGMGVGLIIARSIAEAHGGRIVEERPAPDSTRFRFELPTGGPHG